MTTIGITGGGEEILLSANTPCRMEVPPSGILDMNGSPHLIIEYILKDKQKTLI